MPWSGAALASTRAMRLDDACAQTVGTIAKVHSNGRINYVGEEQTAADGRTAEDAAAGA